METDDAPELKQEACEGYVELQSTIETGNPGKGKFNAFSLHDEWKNLLIDAENYGSSICKYELELGPLVQGELDYATKTASYTASVKYSESDRYKKTIGIIKEGYKKTYKDDWSSDLPKEWPLYSVSSKKDAVYNVNGALIFECKYDFGIQLYDEFINAFEATIDLYHFDNGSYNFRLIGLYDFEFNIVDESGKELIDGKRVLLRAQTNTFRISGIPTEVMDLIDNDKAFFKPVATYLKYGKYNEAKDLAESWRGRKFLENLSESKLNMDKIVFHGVNLDGEKKQKKVELAFDWKRQGDVKNELEKRKNSLVEIPMGTFIAIPGQNYSMSTTEVTQKLYEAVMGENPSCFKNDDNPVETVSFYDAIYFCNKLSEYKGKTPVYSVNGNILVDTWNYEPHKRKYIKGKIEQNTSADGYRLPTKEEWVYAARGGKKNKFSGGNSVNSVAWFYINSAYKTHPVARKKANNYGLYDMSGNVWELVWDSDNGYFPFCKCGGSYTSSDSGYIFEEDYSSKEGLLNDDIGFRIVYNNSN